MRRLTLSIILLALTLTGCFGPIATPDDRRYMINAMPVDFKSVPKTRAIILVATPETTPIYNTTRIAYTVKPYQIGYYSQHQWAETPAQMLLPLLSQSLEKTHAFEAVVVSPYIGNYDYVLNTQIEKMQLNSLNQQAGYFELVIQAQIISVRSARTIATRQFIIHEPTGMVSPYNGVIAANAAVAKALTQITLFSVSSIR